MAANDSEITPDVAQVGTSPEVPVHVPTSVNPPMPEKTTAAPPDSPPARPSRRMAKANPISPAIEPPPAGGGKGARWSQPVVPGDGMGSVSPSGAKQSAGRDGKQTRQGSSENEAESKKKDQPVDLAEAAAKNAPPWLVSALVHMLLVIILGLWFVPIDLQNIISVELLGTEPEISNLEGPQHEIPGDQLIDEMAEGLERPTESPIITPEGLPEVDDPFAAPPSLNVVPDGMASTSTIHAPMIGLALQGREEGSKKVLLGKYGGTGLTEAAVQQGLYWLSKQQREDGSFSLRGPYSDGSQFESTASATAMALLAFQGAGNTHEKGKYRTNVKKAANYLLSLLDDQGNFFHSGPLHSGLYSQAQATIALCELYAMSSDSHLREPAERAIKYCCDAQDKRLGGWRYTPGDDSDMSVTGWFVMALQSARMAKIEVPSITIDNVNRFLESVSLEGGSRYSYIIGGESKRSMTAEALLCRQWLGWEQRDERLSRGGDYLIAAENLPNWNDRDVYYWYYATQMLHHLEGPRWVTWNNIMRYLLPERQEKKGPESGSWSPTGPRPDQWGFHGGRLYVTCLSIYILEVYYRHLPLYSQGLGKNATASAAPASAP